MSKTVYSLVLSQEIVAAVDALAVRGGYSRSSLVNHILAEYASLMSPEKRARQLLDTLEHEAGRRGFRASRSPGGMLTLRTALPYKYNPALSYTVELRGEQAVLGRLHLALRSQNETLLACLALFFDLWRRLENAHLQLPPERDAYRSGGKRHTRVLRRPVQESSAEAEGELIAGYIALMDGCLKTYFHNLDDAPTALRETERHYLAHLQQNIALAQL
ncbi:MAG: hypothetical protein GXY32_04150 [Ruminococcaceae bacterium]|nr:hypothetical protein [Oscillospiraceae bacterium]